MNIPKSDRFEPLVTGPLALERVRVTFREDRPALPGPLAQQIDALWSREGGAGSRGLFDGRLAGLGRWRYDGVALELDLVPVRYRELWYVHVLAGKIEVPPREVLPRALGISAVVLQGEVVLLMLRSGRVGEWPGKLDVFGGHVDWPEGREPDDPAEATRKELEEELGKAGRRANLTRCLGLAEVVRTHKPEIVYLARLPEDATVSLRDTNEEVEELVRLPLAGLTEQLAERWDELTPSAEASLWLLALASSSGLHP